MMLLAITAEGSSSAERVAKRGSERQSVLWKPARLFELWQRLALAAYSLPRGQQQHMMRFPEAETANNNHALWQPRLRAQENSTDDYSHE